MICLLLHYYQDTDILSWAGFKNPALNRKRAVEASEIMGWYAETNTNLLIFHIDDISENTLNQMIKSKKKIRDPSLKALRDQYKVNKRLYRGTLLNYICLRMGFEHRKQINQSGY